MIAVCFIKPSFVCKMSLIKNKSDTGNYRWTNAKFDLPFDIITYILSLFFDLPNVYLVHLVCTF